MWPQIRSAGRMDSFASHHPLQGMKRSSLRPMGLRTEQRRLGPLPPNDTCLKPCCEGRLLFMRQVKFGTQVPAFGFVLVKNHFNSARSWQVTFSCSTPRSTNGSALLILSSEAGKVKPEAHVYDSYAIGGTSGAVAAGVSLRGGAVGAGLRQRRDARCNCVDAGLPFGAGGVQGHAGRLSGGSRQAFSTETGKGSRERAVLSNSAGISEG